MARAITSAELAILQLAHYETWARVTVINPVNGATLTLADRLLSWSLDADLDRPTITGQFLFNLGLADGSYSPLMNAGTRIGGIPLFYPGNYLIHEIVCCAPGGDHSTGYRRLWHGIIDDADPASNGNDVVSVQGRCTMGRWLDKQIAIQTVTVDGTNFGFTVPAADAATVLNYIQTAAWSGDPSFFGAPTFYLDSASGLGVGDYFQDGQQSLYLAMQKIGIQDGSALGGRWIPDTVLGGTIDRYDLHYYDPGRTRADPDWTLTADLIDRVRNLPITRRSIRNRVWVTPADDVRLPQVQFDLDSMIQYGLNDAFISEDKTSHIITPTQALALAAYGLSDMKYPKASLEAERGLFWPVEINDIILFLPNDVHFDVATQVAVSGYSHSGDDQGHASTVFRTRPLPAAAHKYWLDNSRKTEFNSLSPPSGGAPNGATWYQLDELTPP